MAEKSRVYQSYLLRMWEADGNGVPVWRCSLEETKTGQQHHFSSINALIHFLQKMENEPKEPPTHTS
jgi:translation elongation factor EF-Tu-like GTPase